MRRPEDQQVLREHIAILLYNRFHAPAYSVGHLMGWAPSYLELADKLVELADRTAAGEKLGSVIHDQLERKRPEGTDG